MEVYAKWRQRAMRRGEDKANDSLFAFVAGRGLKASGRTVLGAVWGGDCMLVMSPAYTSWPAFFSTLTL
jgi:hypothetical protein